MNGKVVERMGMTSHRGFPISLPSIAAVLALAQRNQGRLSFEDIRDGTSLGTVYAEAMPRYARATGLLERGMRPSSFGERVLRVDPNLGSPQTWWVLHYNLSSPCGGGPLFWMWVLNRVFQFGSEVGQRDVAEGVAEFYAGEGQDPSPASIDRCATAFLGTYWRSDGLGGLGLLDSTGGGTYRVSEPLPPSAWVVGYALADYWACLFPGRQEISLRELTAEGGFARLFFLGSGFLASALGELQSAGLLLLKRDALPFTVVRLWEDDSIFLDRLYE